MGRNNKNVDMGMFAKLEKMKSFGSSRHNDKSAGLDKNKIYSYNTYNNYKQSCKEFSKYLKEVRGIEKFKEITEEHAKDYIKSKEIAGYSAYSYSKDISAINKVMGFNLSKKNCDVANRTIKEITRSRNSKEMDKHVNLENYKEQIEMAQGTGMRRESMLKITALNFTYDINTHLVDQINLKEKGGRQRTTTILQEFRERLTQIVNSRELEEKIFDKYSKNIDNHAFRSDYATERYKELAKERENYNSDKEFLESKNIHLTEKQEKDILNKTQNGYNKAVLRALSKDLGHNRTRVCVEHYLKNS